MSGSKILILDAFNRNQGHGQNNKSKYFPDEQAKRSACSNGQERGSKALIHAQAIVHASFLYQKPKLKTNSHKRDSLALIAAVSSSPIQISSAAALLFDEDFSAVHTDPTWFTYVFTARTSQSKLSWQQRRRTRALHFNNRWIVPLNDEKRPRCSLSIS